METEGYRTGTSVFSRHKKSGINNHIKIRTLSYNQSRSTRETERLTAGNDQGDRLNMTSQYVWLRKPMGVPVKDVKTSGQGTRSFGFRTFQHNTTSK